MIINPQIFTHMERKSAILSLACSRRFCELIFNSETSTVQFFKPVKDKGKLSIANTYIYRSCTFVVDRKACKIVILGSDKAMYPALKFLLKKSLKDVAFEAEMVRFFGPFWKDFF